MTKLSHIIDTDAVYQAAVKQLEHDAIFYQLAHDAIYNAPNSRRIANMLMDPIVPPAAPAPPTDSEWEPTGDPSTWPR